MPSSLVRRLIEDHAGAVITAGEGQEAFEILGREQVDILVSDIGMPDVDGYDLIRRIRSMPGKAGDIPAIAVTAYARADDRQRALLTGYQMHLAKPIEPRELVAAIASLLHRRPRA